MYSLSKSARCQFRKFWSVAIIRVLIYLLISAFGWQVNKGFSISKRLDQIHDWDSVPPRLCSWCKMLLPTHHHPYPHRDGITEVIRFVWTLAEICCQRRQFNRLFMRLLRFDSDTQIFICDLHIEVHGVATRSVLRLTAWRSLVPSPSPLAC